MEVIAARTMTAEQFLEHPPLPGRRGVELVGGDVIVNEPTLLHSAAQGELYYGLRQWIAAGDGRGRVHIPADVRLDAANVFAPDLLWYSPKRAPDIRGEPPYPLPDLAVEVRSPSTWRYDVGAKKVVYDRCGLPELWLVDTTAEEVLAFRRSAPAGTQFDVALELGGADRLETPLLPGFSIEVAAIFVG